MSMYDKTHYNKKKNRERKKNVEIIKKKKRLAIVFTPNFLFKEKHHKKLWAYQMDREGGTSASIWGDDKELKCLLKGGGS